MNLELNNHHYYLRSDVLLKRRGTDIQTALSWLYAKRGIKLSASNTVRIPDLGFQYQALIIIINFPKDIKTSSI
jgi:hypothetical protein